MKGHGGEPWDGFSSTGNVGGGGGEATAERHGAGEDDVGERFGWQGPLLAAPGEGAQASGVTGRYTLALLLLPGGEAEVAGKSMGTGVEAAVGGRPGGEAKRVDGGDNALVAAAIGRPVGKAATGQSGGGA